MAIEKALSSNIRFLLLEADTQLMLLQTYLREEDASLIQRMTERSAYAYNLNLRIQNNYMEQMSTQGESDSMTFRTLATISSEIIRLTDLSRECLLQWANLGEQHQLDLACYHSPIQHIRKSIHLIENALLHRDTRLALQISLSERKLSQQCKKLLKIYTKKLRHKKYTDDLLTGLFSTRTLAQIGDILLRISESIISNNLGQPMDIQRFHALQETVAAWKGEDVIEHMDIQSIAETRSGSGISSLQDRDKKQPLVIYKDGDKRKLKKELQGAEIWQHAYPGLAPRIFAYHSRGEGASLVIEHLRGMTFEKIVLHEPVYIMTEALKALGKTLNGVWGEGQSKRPKRAEFVRQTRKRLADVYAVHPSFRHKKSELCGKKIASFESLLQAAEKIEKELAVPRSVLIHGDFNIDNILYDPKHQRIHFIDLHRSTYMDYVQDISVFMVSHYRLQVFDASQRRRIRKQACDFYRIMKKFARKNQDNTFDIRLALGLARSFATSTRFILDPLMAQRMFLRARYLLEQVIACDPNQVEPYQLTIKELFSD